MSKQWRNDLRWWNLKDQARVRASRKAFGRCEHCWLRQGNVLHHRTYDREGEELLEDVMLVCKTCHGVIHGYVSSLPGTGSEVFVREGSLAHRGDHGRDLWGKPSALWVEYLTEAVSKTEKSEDLGPAHTHGD